MSISTCVENHSLTENLKKGINLISDAGSDKQARDKSLWHFEAALIQAEIADEEAKGNFRP
jgi:hypothetical protein